MEILSNMRSNTRQTILNTNQNGDAKQGISVLIKYFYMKSVCLPSYLDVYRQVEIQLQRLGL